MDECKFSSYWSHSLQVSALLDDNMRVLLKERGSAGETVLHQVMS